MKKIIKGFTLLELIIVMLVISIILISVQMNMPSSANYNLSSFTDRIRTDLRYTNLLALSLNQSYSIVFTANSYSISPSPPSGAYSVAMPSGVTLSPVTVTFDSMGTPNAAANIAITASGVGTNTLTVTAETGFVNG